MDEQLPAEAAQRAAQISAVSYEQEVEVSGDAGAATFTTTSVIRFDSTAAHSWLDFSPERIVSMTLNGVDIDPEAVHDGRIELSSLAPHNELRIVAEVPYQNNGTGMHRQVDADTGKVTLYTNCEPFNAHKWLACFDQPDIKATLALSVVAPEEWKVVSNYPEASSTARPDGTRRVSFEPTPGISTYLMAMAAGELVKFTHTTAKGVECSVYVRQSLVPMFDKDFFFEVTERGLDHFETLFGRPYPFAKYDQVLVPEFNSGAMENPGCITFRDSACVFFGKPTAADYAIVSEFVLHEMAHMWFGDLVTLRGWEDLWLNESFAELMEKFAFDALFPDQHVWADFALGRKAWGLAADQQPSTHAVAGEPGPVSRARDNFDGITYAKGCAVLRQLIEYVGKDEFFEGLRSYIATNAWGNASLADLLGELERTSGRDLSQWSQAWLRTTGMSKLTTESTVGPDGRYQSFSVVQGPGSGDPVLRPQMLRVGLYSRDAEGHLVRTQQLAVEFAAGQARVDIPQLVGEKAPELVILNDDDLTYAKVRMDAASLTTLLGSLGAIQDPLARATSWAAIWDMTRDGELPARDFVGAAVAHAGAETQVTVLDSVLQKAQSAVKLYSSPRHRTAARAQLARAARTEAGRQVAGSDQQLLWARTFIAMADGPSDLAELRGLLQGPSAAFPGLAVDTNLRWNIVQALAEHGDLSGLAALEKADRSDIGQRRGLTARASVPTRAAKLAAWQQITQDTSLGLQQKLALAAGLVRPGQEAALAGYATRFAAFVPQLWARETPELARSLTMALYPTTLTDARSTATLDALLATALPERAMKILRDGRADTRRIVNARAHDVALERGRGGVSAAG